MWLGKDEISIFLLFSAVTPTEDYIQLQTAPAAPLPQNGGFSPKNSPIHGYEGVHEASPPYYNTETFRIPPSKHTDSSNGPSLPPQQLQDKDPSTQPTTITGNYALLYHPWTEVLYYTMNHTVLTYVYEIHVILQKYIIISRIVKL